MKYSTKRTDFASLPMEERRLIGQACLSFKKSQGFEIFFELLQNSHVTDILIENSARNKAGRKLITDEFFMGGMEKIVEIMAMIVEIAAKEENLPLQKEQK